MLFVLFSHWSQQTSKTIHQTSMNVVCAIQSVTSLLAIGLREWKTHLIIQKKIEEYWKRR